MYDEIGKNLAAIRCLAIMCQEYLEDENADDTRQAGVVAAIRHIVEMELEC